MSIKNAAYIVGAYEHPTRKADGISLAQLHADVARGAIEDAGIPRDMIDGYFFGGDAPGFGASRSERPSATLSFSPSRPALRAPLRRETPTRAGLPSPSDA